MIMMSSCASVRYSTDMLPDTIFPSFRTFAVEENCDRDVNPIMAIRFSNAINKEMTSRGYTRSDNPDILVQAFMKNEKRSFIDECDYYDRWEGGEYCKSRYITYEEGTAIIDIVNTNDQRIIWHGTATGGSFNYMSNADNKINAMVSNLLNKFFEQKSMQQSITLN